MNDFQRPCRSWPEGPLGFPMPDAAAKALDKVIRDLPGPPDYRHALVTRAPTELNPGERSDVSWISTESVDRAGEIVTARGMDDSQFRLNPLVTLNHDYDLPPVGRSAWRRRVRDGALIGIKAKTVYPPHPDAWPDGEPWMPDQVFALVQAGLLRGKSIGFLPLQTHVPDTHEVERHGWADDVRLVIDRWLLLEYACVSLPANPHALVEAVSKGMLSRTSEAEVAAAVALRVARLDLPRLITQAVRDAVDRARGTI